MASLSNAEKEKVREELGKYRWYHRIHVADDIWTLPPNDFEAKRMKPLWDMVLKGMDSIDFTNKRVLDVGCRDGLFALEAEKRGATDVVGIDNDLSPGATEFLIPFLDSKVQLYQLNLYDLNPAEMGYFDVILFPGVLYHLRYPFWALKKLVDCLCFGGFLAVEAAMMADKRYEEDSFLYCPGFDEDPFEDATACTLFNRMGLASALYSMSCRLLAHQEIECDAGKGRKGRPRTNRQFLLFEKDAALSSEPGMAWLDAYWLGTHGFHSTGTVW